MTAGIQLYDRLQVEFLVSLTCNGKRGEGGNQLVAAHRMFFFNYYNYMDFQNGDEWLINISSDGSIGALSEGNNLKSVTNIPKKKKT